MLEYLVPLHAIQYDTHYKAPVYVDRFRERDREPTMTTDSAVFMSESGSHRLRVINWAYHLHTEDAPHELRS